MWKIYDIKLTKNYIGRQNKVIKIQKNILIICWSNNLITLHYIHQGRKRSCIHESQHKTIKSLYEWFHNYQSM